jgi:hypothetical protein
MIKLEHYPVSVTIAGNFIKKKLKEDTNTMEITITRDVSGKSDVEQVLQDVRDWFSENPNVPGTIDVKFIPKDKDKWREVKSTRPLRLIRLSD